MWHQWKGGRDEEKKGELQAKGKKNSKNKIKIHNMLNQTHKIFPKNRPPTSTNSFKKGGITCLK